jgi:hypothetical protein
MELHVLGDVCHEVLVLVGLPQELVKAMIFVVLIVLPILPSLLPLLSLVMEFVRKMAIFVPADRA